MKRYTVELTKRIVVHIEAKTRAAACTLAERDTSGHDGAWERAEPEVKVIEEKKL